jgi:hypothetical protein
MVYFVANLRAKNINIFLGVEFYGDTIGSLARYAEPFPKAALQKVPLEISFGLPLPSPTKSREPARLSDN